MIALGDGVTRCRDRRSRVVGGLGGFAEEMQVPGVGMRKIPDGVDYAEAASFTVAYLTAYVALVRRARIAAGEMAARAWRGRRCGMAAVDLGRVLGAKVIATASSDAKREFLKEYGADHVLPSSGFRERSRI